MTVREIIDSIVLVLIKAGSVATVAAIGFYLLTIL